jgi:hypothetical protein
MTILSQYHIFELDTINIYSVLVTAGCAWGQGGEWGLGVVWGLGGTGD